MDTHLVISEKRQVRLMYFVLPVLLAVLYLSGIGYGALDNETDEARRALVAAEMMISGDYVTPTLQGVPYLNKPPLYNWIIVGSFKLFGNFSTFALRFPVIVSVFAFGLIIFLFVKHFTRHMQLAYFAAFAFITNGRILIYDSLQGLIDITFSMVMFLSFMLVYLYEQKNKYWHLFIITYILTAIGFMLKGLPAIACQAITLISWFSYQRKVRKLFVPAHLVGIGCFMLPLAIYYYLYFSRNDIVSFKLFSNLFHESIKRTVIVQGTHKTVFHLFTFPFEFLYHFAPWTFLVILLFDKTIRNVLRHDNFIAFNIIVFFSNLILYWTSPQVYARYLFMLVPLLFIVLLYSYFMLKDTNGLMKKIVDYYFIAFIIIIALACFIAPSIAEVKKVDQAVYKCVIIGSMLALCAYYMIKQPSHRLLLFALSICVFRLGFNWLVVENRGERYRQLEETAAIITRLAQDKELYILTNTKVGESFDGMTYHIITRRRKLLTFANTIDYKSLYIADKEVLVGKNYQALIRFSNYNSAPLLLVRFLQ